MFHLHFGFKHKQKCFKCVLEKHMRSKGTLLILKQLILSQDFKVSEEHNPWHSNCKTHCIVTRKGKKAVSAKD